MHNYFGKKNTFELFSLKVESMNFAFIIYFELLVELPDAIIFFTNTPNNFLKHFPSILFIHFFFVYRWKFIVFPFSRYFACFWFRRVRRGNSHRTLSRRSIAIFFIHIRACITASNTISVVVSIQ